jgi:hypothetical protein
MANARGARWSCCLFVGALITHGASSYAQPVFTDQEDAMRCGNDLVPLGSTESKVLNTCGPPASAEERNIASGGRSRGRVRVGTWIYRFAGSFVRTLTFHDGMLKRIDVGD